MKKRIIALKIVVYVVLIPIIVLILADLGIMLSAKFYWGADYLKGASGLRLWFMLISLSFYLTITYYFFMIMFLIVKNKSWRFLVTSFFVVLPVLYYQATSNYDYRLTVSFATFNCTYYLLFFMARYIFEIKYRRLIQ